MKSFGPDPQHLYELAANQGGYFSSRDAEQAGFSRSLLAWHVRRGSFQRLSRGVYRLSRFPASPHEDLTAAAIRAGATPRAGDAVASHVTALALHDLTDIAPDRYEFTIPHAKRYRRTPPGIVLHTTTRPLPADEIEVVDGIRTTTAARALIDAAAAHYGPEQVERGVWESIRRAKATPEEFERVLAHESESLRRRFREYVEHARERLKVL
ncbi:MAG: type IV toxin-antitoxin system AbiEi family antitoxin domain-containing protein [bacterium]|nr:type IV toxin-antitoxin system AbiEi family antitoxin domain-containing protein [bacterium]